MEQEDNRRVLKVVGGALLLVLSIPIAVLIGVGFGASSNPEYLGMAIIPMGLCFMGYWLLRSCKTEPVAEVSE